MRWTHEKQTLVGRSPAQGNRRWWYVVDYVLLYQSAVADHYRHLDGGFFNPRKDDKNMRPRNFNRDFNRTSAFIRLIFVFIITFKLALLALVIWTGISLYTVGLDGVGHAIGSFVGAVQEGMN